MYDEADRKQDEAQEDLGQAWDKTKDAANNGWEATKEELGVDREYGTSDGDESASMSLTDDEEVEASRRAGNEEDDALLTDREA